MKLVSWNVNGIRAGLKKGLLEYMLSAKADVLCIQETKAHPGDVQHVAWPKGYQVFYNSADKKGYSGTAIFTRHEPICVKNGIGKEEHDKEGRVITLEYKEFWLVNVYQPNSQRGLARVAYRTEAWDPAFLKYIKKLENKGKPVIFCGDLNVAHLDIDLSNPKANKMNAGFTEAERTNFTKIIDSGFIDTFRAFNQEPGNHSWWSQFNDCRARNIGWRVDYFVASEALRSSLKKAWIEPEIMGSDHCPVGLEIKLA